MRRGLLRTAASGRQWSAAPMGDAALLLRWHGAPIMAGSAIRYLAARLRHRAPRGVVELIPGIDSLLICYNPLETSAVELTQKVSKRRPRLVRPRGVSSALHCVEVVYGGEAGPDLAHVAHAAGLSTAEVVALHTSRPMPVLMVGFMPGYPYIGELPGPLRLPRRAVPRQAVPAGSVAIANDQTGIYPSRSPGGWHVIGRTEVALFNPLRAPPALMQAGDYVQFLALT